MPLADLIVTPAWHESFPDGAVAMLALEGVSNTSNHSALDAEKAALEADLRQRFGHLTRSELRALPALRAYSSYYRRFDKTYHVQLQLESVVLKGKPIGSVSALVETMFMAELKNQLLTAVHDLALLELPLQIDYAADATPYLLANGKEGALRPGDMYMADARGPICSVIYGQDQRTRVTPETSSALFVTYVPPGIDPALVEQHQEDLARYVRLVSPTATLVAERIVR